MDVPSVDELVGHRQGGTDAQNLVGNRILIENGINQYGFYLAHDSALLFINF